MGPLCCYLLLVATTCHHSLALDLHVGVLKDTVMYARSTLQAMLAEEVKTADIRLLKKDSNKSPEEHPLLQESSMEKKEAISMFITKWGDHYDWTADLDTEYRSVGQAAELFHSENYDPKLGTVLILHDSCGSIKSPSVVKVTEALKLRNFDVNFNIFLLDFPKLGCKMLANAGSYKLDFNPQIKILADSIADVFLEGMNAGRLTANNTHLIGMGASSLVSGLAARKVQELTAEKLGSLLILDPPVRLVRKASYKPHATAVHVYHTFTVMPKMGPKIGLGTADFLFDGAKKRPECRRIRGGCFQKFGVHLFVSTLLYPRLFPSRWCPSWKWFTKHICDNNDFDYPSFPPNPTTEGTFDLMLGDKFPYGLGDEGIFKQTKEGEGALVQGEVVDATQLSDQEYQHELEKEVMQMRTDLMNCLKSVGLSHTAAMRCVNEIQRHIKRLTDKGFLKKESCETVAMSPTGKKCKYTLRTGNEFFMPF